MVDGKGTDEGSGSVAPAAVDVLETLGRYQLLERIAEGGMAEVFKAKSLGVEGFEKQLVVKRILPRLAENPAFVRMFIHEAKLAVRLSHANIVQVFDLGRVESSGDGSPSYFIAMEYVAGLDLATVLARLATRSRAESTSPDVVLGVPIGAAVYIVGEVAKALDHAHRRADEKGRPLGVVHRDISPHNVLLSWEGDVKVTDFGIARASEVAAERGASLADTESTEFATQFSAVRVTGKVAFMSPEQARGLDTDARSDLYSLGIVLYQLLAGNNPFSAPTDAETTRRIIASEYPPLTIVRPDVPAALTAIVDRLLRKDPAERFGSAAEVFEELLAFVYTSGERFGAADLATLLSPLAAAEAELEFEVIDVLDESTSSDDKTPVEVPHRILDEPPSARPSDLAAAGQVANERREVTLAVFPRANHSEANTRPSLVPSDGPSRASLRAVLERHGAWVEEFSESRLVAIFGLGDTDGRDGEAAVRAALSLVRERGPGEVAGAGVHSGPLSIDNGGLPLRDARFDALVGMAERLAAAAKGQVGLSALTARLVRRAFVTEPFSSDERAVLDGYTVRGALTFEGARTRFVGRRQELKRLGALLAIATRGEAQLVFVQGKTGVGKSRFIDEATRRLVRGKFKVALYTCSCPLNGTSEPWSGLRELLHALCGTQPDDDVERLFAVGPRLRALGLTEREAESVLSLLGAPVDVTAAELRAGLRVGFERMVASLCHDRLHGFAFDDAQSLDAESYDAIVRTIHRGRNLRAVFLLSLRGDSSPDVPQNAAFRTLQQKRRVHVLELGELNEGELESLVGHQLGARAVPRDLLEYVRACAGGHPLFVEELVRELCDSGVVQVSNGEAVLKSSSGTAAPRTLRTLIADRVSRLPQRERRVLQGLAILGEPANTVVLSSVIQQILPSVDRHIGVLEKKGLVQRIGASQVRFASPLYQEIVLDAMAQASCQALHASAARVYGEQPPGAGEAAERMAGHLLASGERALSSQAYWRAGRERRAMGQVEPAVRMMMRGAELDDVGTVAPEQLLAQLVELAEVVARTASAPGLREVIGPLVRELQVRGDLSQRIFGMVEWSRTLAAANQFEDAMRVLDELKDLVAKEPHDEPDQRRAHDVAVLAAECELCARQGRVIRGRLACDELDSLGATLEVRTALASSVIRASTGDTTRALELLDSVEGGLSESDLPRRIAVSKHRAIVQFNRRDFAAAAREANKAARAALSAGLRFEAALALHNLGDAFDRLGDHPRAYAAFVESLDLARQLDQERLSNLNQIHLCMLDGLRSAEGFEEKLRALIRFADGRSYLWDVIEGRYLLARLYSAHGSHEKARRLLEEVVASAREHGHGLIAEDADALLRKLTPQVD